MRKSIWAILFIGVFGFVAVIVMLLYTFPDLPIHWHFVEISKHLRETYHLEKAVLKIVSENGENVFYIDYATMTDSHYDSAIYYKEMKEIGKSAITLYEGKDKNSIESIHITRTEIEGSGCFQKSFTISKRIKNPLMEKDFNGERY